MLSVKAKWVPSETLGVTKQVISVFINGELLSRTELPITDAENVFAVKNGDLVRVELFATNGVEDSDVVFAEMTVPFGKPVAPTGLTLELIEE